MDMHGGDLATEFRSLLLANNDQFTIPFMYNLANIFPCLRTNAKNKRKKQAQKTSKERLQVRVTIYIFLFLIDVNSVVQLPDIVPFKHVLFVLRNGDN